MIVRIVSKGWENFTGSMGHQALFKDGLSVGELGARQVARIGSSLQIIDVSTGLQVGPSVVHRDLQFRDTTVSPQLATKTQEDRTAEFDRERLAADETARKKADAEALAAAQKRAQDQVDEQIVYTRAELEAIGSQDGIGGLRLIATPIGINKRSISDLVEAILTHQTRIAAA